MIDQQTYKKNLTLLESLKTKKSKIEGNIETRNTQIDKINNDIDDLKKQIKDDFNIKPNEIKNAIAEKELAFANKLQEIQKKLEELEESNA